LVHSVSGLAMKDGVPGLVQGQIPGGGPQKLRTYYENNCQKHRLLVGQSRNNESSYQLYIGLLVVVAVGLLHFYSSTVNVI